MTSNGSRAEVVILGAGLAGMTAAYQLRDLNPLVIEERDRVGGRTLSGRHGDYWFNSGAQFVWDHRTLELCRELGIEILDATGAKASLYLRDRLVQGASPYTMFLRLPLSLRERIDLGRTILRLRRLAGRAEQLDSGEIDARSLADLMGSVSPLTRRVLDLVSETGTGLSTDEVSGWIGLGYAIHLFGGDVNATLKQVVGGTQAITETIRDRLDPGQILFESPVESIEAADGSVRIRYRRDGQLNELEARRAIVTFPADAVLDCLQGLPQAKRAGLERMVPYGKIISVAWLTAERGPMPWDELLVTPVVAEMSFEQISNNGFFLQRARSPHRPPGGVLVTLSTGARAERIWELDDDTIVDLQREELARIYPAGADVLAGAEARVARWRGFPAFRKRWLAHQGAIREPVGSAFFCGDYTAQPGTPGAVGSGYQVARAVRRSLEAAAPEPVRGDASRTAKSRSAG